MGEKLRKIDFKGYLIAAVVAMIVLDIRTLLINWSGNIWSTLVDLYYIHAATANGLGLLRIM